MDKFSDPSRTGRWRRPGRAPDPGVRPNLTGRPDPRIPDPGIPGPSARPDPGVAGELTWGPARWISSATLLAMLAALAWRLLDQDPENRVVAAVLVVVFAVVTLLLVRIRVRLRVVPGGIAVTGPLHTRQIDWSQIDSISTPHRGRLGRRSAMLEIEVRPTAEGSCDPTDAVTAADPVTAIDPVTAAGTTDPDGTDDADDVLLAFGRFDLGADPREVGRILLRLRP